MVVGGGGGVARARARACGGFTLLQPAAPPARCSHGVGSGCLAPHPLCFAPAPAPAWRAPPTCCARSSSPSPAARKLVELLRGLASSGRAIITTIHQPSSNIYRQLDTVLLLSQVRPPRLQASHVQGGTCLQATAPTLPDKRRVFSSSLPMGKQALSSFAWRHVHSQCSAPPRPPGWLQGHPIFYGKGSEAAVWFEALGVPCPFGVNIADWILDLANGEVAAKQT